MCLNFVANANRKRRQSSSVTILSIAKLQIYIEFCKGVELPFYHAKNVRRSLASMNRSRYYLKIFFGLQS